MKKLLILSGKGGTGKTTTAAAFIQFSKARAIADCDVDAPNLHLVTNVQIKPDVSDFIGASKAEIDSYKCSGCGKCIEHCRFHAIQKMDGVCQVNEYACEGCGVCEYEL
ncbi:MAG: 4Fe-4S binding protein [Lachnospiraceae bacterium]|nr:4Fe-4S binding protein [Lachnospiraceae bacterium]